MKRMLAIFSLIAAGILPVATVDAQEVTSDTQIVNHLTMNQWVRATENGELSGRVYLPGVNGEAKALANVTVAMKSRDGEVLRATTDSKGVFSVKNVPSGVYALTARGDNVFACCAMHVVDASVSSDVELPTEAEVAVANVDFTVVNTAVIRYMPTSVRSFDSSLADAKLDSLKDRIRSQDVFRVVQTDGGMKGRIHLAGVQRDALGDAEMTNVFLFKEGMEIARTLTGENGTFSFANIATGNYSVMAIGPDGIGLIGFELVDSSLEPATASNVAADGTQLVGFGHHRRHNQCCCEEFAIQVAPCPEVVTCVEEVIITETVIDEGCGCGVPGEILEGEVVMDGFGNPMAGGGYAPGGGGGFSGGGGGGGGFGGGGLAALAGLGAIGAIIATTSDDDNNAITVPVVASPAVPAN
ncbi:Cna protein B-type domain protein [Rubripirellula lacrimiformis]|uniref:Cna protein B-type domain protein n=1 Tax=Rubripirellula lacrimiformis TaxID=1930273 RepID=A0A517N785_9BACT|nr:carboxypeptidase-like regulatory domain-containing protein [Rubripirellula lacrimiformis]QDT02992.1 Cna protein B-type domain protein [Rubripirellula lacrimiformis]